MADRSDTDAPNWHRRLVLGAVGVLAALAAWYLAAAVIPRWWAQRLGDVISGRLIFGSFLGLVIGALCTAVPIVVLWLGWRVRAGFRRAIVFIGIAALVATPNLATLGIVVGDGNAAHAGERILDVDGPGFRGGTLVGTIVGVFATTFVVYLVGSRRRSKRTADGLRRELDERDQD